jgi:hypothetical protein
VLEYYASIQYPYGSLDACMKEGRRHENGGQLIAVRPSAAVRQKTFPRPLACKDVVAWVININTHPIRIGTLKGMCHKMNIFLKTYISK